MTRDAVVQLPLDSSGKKVDNSLVTDVSVTDPQTPVDVLRQRINIADPDNANALLPLRNGRPAPDDYAVPVRIIQDSQSEPLTQDDALRAILKTLQKLVEFQSIWTDYLAPGPVVAKIDETDFVYVNGMLLKPKFAFANIAASQTDSVIVAAIGGRKIRVLSFRVMAGGTATNFTFNTKSVTTAAGVAITEQFQCGANGGQIGPYSSTGHFETKDGEGLTGTTGAGSTVGVGVVYVDYRVASPPPIR